MSASPERQIHATRGGSPASSHPADQVPREALLRLNRPALGRWLWAVTVDWSLIAGSMLLVARYSHPFSWFLALFVIGSRQHAISILGHEAVHRAVSRRRWLNDGLAQVACFWPVASDLEAYGKFHLGHHKHLNAPQDPEMEYRLLGAPGWDLPRTRRGVALRFVLDLCGLGAFEVLRILRFTAPRSMRAAVGPVAMWGLAAAAAVLSGKLWVFGLYFASFFTGFAAVWRFRCWLEHLGTDDTHRIALPRWQAFWLAPHNAWLHWEHHHWAGVPCFNLPKLRELATGTPIMTVPELLLSYERSTPVRSGEPSALAQSGF
jgi:fatty acid desaturase